MTAASLPSEIPYIDSGYIGISNAATKKSRENGEAETGFEAVGEKSERTDSTKATARAISATARAIPKTGNPSSARKTPSMQSIGRITDRGANSFFFVKEVPPKTKCIVKTSIWQAMYLRELICEITLSAPKIPPHRAKTDPFE